jgi:hypothetical protein
VLVSRSSKWQEPCSELAVAFEGEYRPEKEGERDKQSKLVGCMKGVEDRSMGNRDGRARRNGEIVVRMRWPIRKSNMDVSGLSI